MSLLILFNSAVVAGTLVSVPIVQTVRAGGVQFDLVYDSAALTLEEFIPAVGTSPITNPQPGRFRFIVTQTTPLPEELGVFVFRVNGASLLTLENVVVGSPLGENIEVEIINGAVNLESDMNYEAFWEAPASSYGITGTRVFVGESNNVLDGTFQQVADVSQPANVAGFSLDANIGPRYAYAVHYDAEGDTSPNSVVVQFSTDLALPAPIGFGVRVV